MPSRSAILAVAVTFATCLLPLAAQALPRESCAKLTLWVASDVALHHGGWGTEPVYRAAITGTTMHNAEFVAWVDDPCFVSHEDLTVAEQSITGRGLPEPGADLQAVAALLERVYGPSIAADFSGAATTRLPNELILLGKQQAYVLHWVDETGVPGQWPSYTEWLEVWPRDAQLPDH